MIYTSFLGFLIIILIPIFINGIENSMARSRCDEIVKGAMAISASLRTNSPTIPSQFPFASLKKRTINNFQNIINLLLLVPLEPNRPSLTSFISYVKFTISAIFLVKSTQYPIYRSFPV